MCGIAGEIRTDHRGPSKVALQSASAILEPRGPDGAGECTGEFWGFVHRRLSIIDLSDSGRQPMQIPELKKTIVFNGEIYNYKELRDQLMNLGHSFRSESDTEVLLRAYHQWGPEFVEKLYGMFAFVIHDENKEIFFMARDRLGIKPFYYSQTSSGFRFASNVRALSVFEDVDNSVDPIALHHYMSLHAIVPEPRTIFKGVKKLPAAHTATLTYQGDLHTKRYWHPTYEARTDLSEDQWEEQITEALQVAVRRRLVADVPVGLFLSGGVDSSLIAALMVEEGVDLQTFSIGFEGAGSEDGSEFQYSDLVAKKYNTKHHKIAATTKEILEHLPQCIASMNEPMASYDNIGFFLLSKFSSRSVKVVQSGQGADEVFGGYHWYQKLKGSNDVLKDYKNVFLDRSHQKMKQVLADGYYTEDWTHQFLSSEFDQFPGLSAVDQALRIDTHTMLVEDPVKRVDSNTMAWGLEARVPFLDHDLVELAAQMPSGLKLQDDGKYLLKKIARKYVPSSVIDRPKGYFPVPQLKYIQGPFLDFVRQYLTQDAVRRRGLFKYDYIEKLMQDPSRFITPLRGSELWQIAVLEMWLQHMERASG